MCVNMTVCLRFIPIDWEGNKILLLGAAFVVLKLKPNLKKKKRSCDLQFKFAGERAHTIK